jgi:hypothetical protein
LATHEEEAGPRPAPIVMQVVGDVSPNGEAIGLQIERSDQGPVDLCVRTQDLKYFVSILLNLGSEARRRQAPAGSDSDAPPTEAIPLPLDAINVGQNVDDQTFLLLEVGSASLMFMLPPNCVQQIGQTLLAMSAKASSKPS